MNHEYFMRLAIEKCFEGIRYGQSPFGACIVKSGKVISCVHNTVWKSTDITAHAEVHAIRAACKRLKTVDLSGCVIYSTCEPCPMCFSAIHWAKISTIYYGSNISDAQSLGFGELTISNKRMKSLAGSSVKVVGNFLRGEALELFNTWMMQEKRRLY
ncbi:MAG TPA: nucleoside deaminase [Bacteroidetes bacterium]|nr:nucleoside deaminase [Bacteroidota bacterium]